MALIERLKKFDPNFGERLTSTTNSTPLHLAAQFSNSVAVIQELIQVHPAALEMENQNHDTPLFCALKNRTANAPDILQVLIDAAPHTVRRRGHRFPPLHELLNDYKIVPKSSKAKMVSILLRAFPAAVDINVFSDSLTNSLFPIQIAAKYCTTEVFKMIAEANPAQLSMTSNRVAHYCAAVAGNMSNLRYIHSVMPELL